MFTQDEVINVLQALNFKGVHLRSGTIRSACGIHGGSGRINFAGFLDSFGDWRFACHSHKCVFGASLFTVVGKVLECSPQEAAQWISNQLGRPVVLPSDTKEILPVAPPREVSLCDAEAVDRLAALYPYHAYWQSRGFSEEAVAAYKLSYRSLDNRAIIPVYTDLGYVGLISRSMDGSEPKYCWESPNQKDFLYGVPQALGRALILGGRRVVLLVEGTLDVIKLWMAGYPAVATQTNRISSGQVETLIEHWDAVMVIPDADEAGVHLVTSAQKHLAPFVDLGVCELVGGKDPDDFSTDDLSQIGTILQDWKNTWHARRRKLQSFQLSKQATAE